MFALGMRHQKMREQEEKERQRAALLRKKQILAAQQAQQAKQGVAALAVPEKDHDEEGAAEPGKEGAEGGRRPSHGRISAAADMKRPPSTENVKHMATTKNGHHVSKKH